MKSDRSWSIAVVLAILSFTTFIIFLIIALAPGIDKFKNRNRGRNIIEKEQIPEDHRDKDTLTFDTSAGRNENISGYL